VPERTISVVPPIDSQPATASHTTDPDLEPRNRPLAYPAEDALRTRPVVGIGVVGYGY